MTANNHTAPSVAPSPDTKKVFTLQYPVKFQETRYTQLALRRPKVKDTRFLLEKIDTDPLGAQADFLASLANVPPGVFDELDLVDMKAIVAWAMSFTNDIETKS